MMSSSAWIRLVAVADSDILHRNPELVFRESNYESRIARDGSGAVLTVTGGGDTLTAPLLWAFGRGQAGQTYVFERGGTYYESRVSFYNELRGLDLTMGAQAIKPKNIEDAAGHRDGLADQHRCRRRLGDRCWRCRVPIGRWAWGSVQSSDSGRRWMRRMRRCL